MAERGQLLALRCEMPQCHHHKGRGAFDPLTAARTMWAPSRDHYPILKSAGGKLVPHNVRLSHTECNQRDYNRRKQIGTLLAKGKSLEEIAETLNRKDAPRSTALTDGRPPWCARPTCPSPGSALGAALRESGHGVAGMSGLSGNNPSRVPCVSTSRPPAWDIPVYTGDMKVVKVRRVGNSNVVWIPRRVPRAWLRRRNVGARRGARERRVADHADRAGARSDPRHRTARS